MNVKKAFDLKVYVELKDRHLVADMQIVTLSATLQDSYGQSTLHTAVLERSDAVAILPYDVTRDEIVLVRQFRAGPYLRDGDTTLLEIIAGYLDPNESAEIAAARELREETGMSRISSTSDGCIRPSPQPNPGTRLLREWRGVTHEVLVHDEGVQYRGQKYRSLSEVAKVITGSKWSGPVFFGLRKRAK